MIGILALIVVIELLYMFIKKNPKYSPEQEAQELVAKAGIEAKQIEADAEKELAAVEADIKTPLVNVEADIKKL